MAIVAAAATIALANTGHASDEVAPPPNVVLILADDLGWNDVGYHGSEIRTPHIDAIAKRGIELDRMYVQPTCSPTRAALLTGKSSLRLGVTRPISKHSPKGLSLDEKLLPEYFRDAGYQTAMTGKWHLGHHEKVYLPHRRGFDHFYGNVTGGIGYWDHTHGGRLDWQRNGETLYEDGYSTHLVTDEAVRLLRERDPLRPMFLYVAYTAPHLPNEAPEETIAKYAAIEDPNRRAHAAMVDELDTGIGRLLATLAEEGLQDDTIVWFLSDNGGLNRSAYPEPLLRLVDGLVWLFGRPIPVPALEFLRSNVEEGGSDNSPLLGGKMTVSEGGVRVPGAVWWPGHLEGSKSRAFVGVSDLLPTLLEAAGLGAATPANLDGASRLAALAGGDEADAHPDHIVTAPGGLALFRGPWKLVVPQGPLADSPTLYRIAEDPTESNDLATAHPEVVSTLLAAAQAWPQGPSIHGSLWTVFWDPDRFGGGDEAGEPWADLAR